MDLLELKKCGFESYKKGDFKQALECFDTIISSSPKPPLSILDSRAGTYIKLGELEKALKDGKRMIKGAEEKAVGYLRTAQILHRMEKSDKALSIYKRGLTKVKSSDEDIKKLQAMYRKLRPIDPFEELPIELLETILNYLSFTQKINLLRVCKKWNRALDSMPSVWRDLDLSKAKPDISLGYFKKQLRRTHGRLTHATLPLKIKSWDVALHMRDELLSNSPQLEYLQIHNWNIAELKPRGRAAPLQKVPKLRTLIVSPPEIRIGQVMNALTLLQHPERVEFHNILPNSKPLEWGMDLSKLRVLKLHAFDKDIKDSLELSLDGLFPKITQLHELSLHMSASHQLYIPNDLSIFKELRVLSIKNVVCELCPCFPPTLESLELNGLKWRLNIDAGDRDDDHMRRNDFSGLKSLTIRPWRCHLSVFLNAVLQDSQNRTKKMFLEGFKETEDPLTTLAAIISSGHLTNVIELGLPDCEINDNLADLIMTHCPRLESLDASCNPKLTGVGVKALILRKGTKVRTNLTYINLDECRGVGKDAVDWARLMGLKVDFRFKEMKGSNRVRTG